jgi:microcystin-dependent protein
MTPTAPLIGEIGIFTGNFVPVGWLACDGSLQKIQDYPSLYQLLATTYGGDGATTFALPDLRGRTAVGASPATGGYQIGELNGSENVAVTVATLPNHSHTMIGTDVVGGVESPLNAFPAVVNGTHNKYHKGAPDVAIAQDSLLPAGNPQTQPHNNLQPFLTLTYVICTEGIFPQ